MLTQSELNVQNIGFLIKTIIVGDASVGKSSILKRFTSNDFQDTYNATIGLEFESKDVTIQSDNQEDSSKITLQIWDTAGQESFRSIVKSFYRNSAAVLLVYDTKKRKTFDGLKNWIQEIKENSHNDVIIVLIGNKMDGEQDEVEVKEKEIQELLQNHSLAIHFYTSALNNYNIEQSFKYVATEVYNRFIKDKSQLKNGFRQSTRSLSIDSNKARELQQQIDQQESSQSTPTHKYSIKNKIKNNSINNESSVKEHLISKTESEKSKKKGCC
ncbi:hypothetical protein ABPG72_019662 [Tetrahymena utriculariae]